MSNKVGGPASPAGQLPAAPWRRTIRKSAPSRAPITQGSIIDALLTVIDAEGLDGLSMRRIADELETGPATIYAHFASKDDLLDMTIDRVIGEVQVPDPEPGRWSDQLASVARELHAALGSHRDLARAALGRVPTGPGALQLGERMLAILVAADVPIRPSSMAIERILLYVNAHAYEASLYVANLPGSGSDIEQGTQQFLRQVRDFYASLPSDRFPLTSQHADELTAPSGPERFEFGLALLLEGLAARSSRDWTAPAG